MRGSNTRGGEASETANTIMMGRIAGSHAPGIGYLATTSQKRGGNSQEMGPVDSLQRIKIFIASPRDLEKERVIFRDVVNHVNEVKAHSQNLHLVAVGWEDTLPGKGRPQALINEDVKASDLFIMLLWRRWGTPTGEYSSGVEEEYEIARASSNSKGNPQIWMYFRSVPDEMLADPGPQLRKVLQFRAKIEREHKFLFITYEDENDWAAKFEVHLCRWIDKFQPFQKREVSSSIPGDFESRLTALMGQLQQIRLEFQTSQTKLRNEALTLGREAAKFATSGQLSRAENSFARSLELFPEPETLEAYGSFLERIGLLSKAEERFCQLRRLGETMGRHDLISLALSRLGDIYDTRGEARKAEQMYEEALALDKRIGNRKGLSREHHNLGLIYYSRGDLDKAERMYRKSLAIDKELNNEEGIADDYGNLGLIHYDRGDLETAEKMHRKALAIDEELGNMEGCADDYNNLGLVELARDHLETAKTLFGRAFDFNRTIGSKDGMADDSFGLASVSLKEKAYELAEEFVAEAMSLNRDLERHAELVDNLVLLASLCSGKGEPVRARKALEEALTLSESLNLEHKTQEIERALRSLEKES